MHDLRQTAPAKPPRSSGPRAPVVRIEVVRQCWPLFGRQTTLNAAAYCASLSSSSAGQKRSEQGVGTRVTVYGSEGWPSKRRDGGTCGCQWGAQDNPDDLHPGLLRRGLLGMTGSLEYREVRREHMVAAGLGNTWWQYLLLVVLVAASWAGVPAIGTAALGIAAVAASQRRLDLAVVIAVAVVAGEAGGLCDYAIGRRWGRQLLERPGRHQARREKIVEHGEGLYARWGWRYSSPPLSSRARRRCRRTGSLSGICSIRLCGQCRWRPAPTGWAGSPRAITRGTMSPSWSSGSALGRSLSSLPCGVT